MQLHNYQVLARNFVLNRLHSNIGAGLWLDCGLGKTAVTLHALETMKGFGEISRAIVVAPSRVIATAWPKEIKAWGLPLTYSWIKGDDEEKEEAYQAKPDIYFISTESLATRVYSEDRAARSKRTQLLPWLLKKKLGVNCVVVDEITKFKNWSANRTKGLKKLIKTVPKRITLTGTPASNSLGDIFSQQFILDGGKTLGPHIGTFREGYMRSCGYEGRSWEMRPEEVPGLLNLLAPWYLHQSALDHLDLPKLLHNEIDVELPPKAMAIYKEFRQQMFVEINNRGVGTMAASGRYSTCRQIAGGNAYDEDGEPIAVHDAKLDALEDLFDELHGKPLLVGYWFDHEYKRIGKRFPNAAVIRGGTRASVTAKIIEDWQAGNLKMIIAQASAVAHGVDGLQKGCNDLCWYTLPDQPEIKHQFEKRVFRQGVIGDQVRFHYLLAEGTLDRAIKRTLDKKDATERDVLQAVKDMAKDD